MADIMERIKGWGLVGAILGLVATLISMYYPKGGILNLKLASPIELNVAGNLNAGLATTVGEKFFGFFNGLLPIQGNVWIYAALTGAILMIVGRYIIDYIPIFKPSTKTGKMTLVLLWGFIGLGLLLKFFTLNLSVAGASIIGTLLIYFAILALATKFVMEMFNLNIPE